MRKYIDLTKKFDGIVYHCSPDKFSEFHINPRRGVYFSNEPDHDYGNHIYKCNVTLQSPYYSSSIDSFIEIDRLILIEHGFDGRIVDYSEESDYEMFDVIAFYDHQINIIEMT